jgi:peroxiredoxin
MKNILIAGITLIALSCGTHQKPDGFIIQGRIKNLKQKEVFLVTYKNDAATRLDSARVDTLKGTFQLHGKLVTPDLMYIAFSDGSEIEIFVENAEITVQGDSIQNAIIKGSASNDTYSAYKAGRDSLGKSFDGMQAAYDSVLAKYKTARAAGNQKEMKAYYDQMAKIEAIPDASLKSYNFAFIKNHPASFVAPAILWNELAYAMDAPDLNIVLKKLDTAVLKSDYVRLLNERIETLKKVAIGMPAPDFMMNDTLGKPQKFSSYFGKILLVDFWASWCGPCRRENPNVVAAYKEYHAKGFDILGISLDKDHDRWVKAIRDDKLEWHHLSDLQGWKNSAARLYGIRSIPANMLIDKNGIIIAKNIMGDELTDKLSDLTN